MVQCVSYQGPQLHQMMHQNPNGARDLHNAGTMMGQSSQSYNDAATALRQAQSLMSETWTGAGADSATGGVNGVILAAQTTSTNLAQAQGSLQSQAGAFDTAKAAMQQIDANRPDDSHWYDSIPLVGDSDKAAAAQWDAQNKANIAAYTTYTSSTLPNQTQLPPDFQNNALTNPSSTASPAPTAVGSIGSGVAAGIGASGGRTAPHRTSGSAPTGAGGGRPVSLSTGTGSVGPSSGGLNQANTQTRTSGYSGPGGRSGPTASGFGPSGGMDPSGMGGLSGFGPMGGGGDSAYSGGSGSGGSSGGGSGSAGGRVSGGAGAPSEQPGAGSRTGGGAGAASAESAAARSGTASAAGGSRSSSGMGGMGGHGGKGGGEDEEHQRKYLQPMEDYDGIFLGDMDLTVPPVIGE